MTIYTVYFTLSFPATVLSVARRLEYYQALDNAHTRNDYTDFLKLIAEIVEDSFNPYWFALGLEAI